MRETLIGGVFAALVVAAIISGCKAAEPLVWTKPRTPPRPWNRHCDKPQPDEPGEWSPVVTKDGQQWMRSPDGLVFAGDGRRCGRGLYFKGRGEWVHEWDTAPAGIKNDSTPEGMTDGQKLGLWFGAQFVHRG